MRQVFLTIALAAVTAACFAQTRVYVRKDEFSDDIFLRRYSSGDLVAHFELDTLRDSLFLMVTRENVREVHDYMTALLDKYRDWSRTARMNRLTSFEKPVDIESPVVMFLWTEETKSDFPRLIIPTMELFSTEGRWIRPVFSVNKEGRCSLWVNLELKCDDRRYRGTHRTSFPLHDDDLRKIIRWTDFDRLERIYERKKPKMTNEEINALFE